MGEIKSTLEIIMEKTKGLTMSEEERKTFQKEKVEGRVKGLAQKYLDGFLTLDGLKKEIESFSPEKDPMVMKAFRRECLDRMDPEIDGGPLFQILREVVGVDQSPFRELQAEYQRRLQQEKEGRRQSALEKLKKRGISGTAVIPNPAADPDWQGVLREMKQAFRDELDQILR